MSSGNFWDTITRQTETQKNGESFKNEFHPTLYEKKNEWKILYYKTTIITPQSAIFSKNQVWNKKESARSCSEAERELGRIEVLKVRSRGRDSTSDISRITFRCNNINADDRTSMHKKPHEKTETNFYLGGQAHNN